VLLVFDTHAVNHLLYKDLGYDPFKSFEHVSLLVTSPHVLAGATTSRRAPSPSSWPSRRPTRET